MKTNVKTAEEKSMFQIRNGGRSYNLSRLWSDFEIESNEKEKGKVKLKPGEALR